MKRLLVILSAVMMIGFAWISVVSAQNFPTTSAPAAGPRQGSASVQQQMVYGYVPPPPIRHTWPGGYKVIFHEMLNTLSQHMLGHY